MHNVLLKSITCPVLLQISQCSDWFTWQELEEHATLSALGKSVYLSGIFHRVILIQSMIDQRS